MCGDDRRLPSRKPRKKQSCWSGPKTKQCGHGYALDLNRALFYGSGIAPRPLTGPDGRPVDPDHVHAHLRPSARIGVMVAHQKFGFSLDFFIEGVFVGRGKCVGEGVRWTGVRPAVSLRNQNDKATLRPALGVAGVVGSAPGPRPEIRQLNG